MASDLMSSTRTVRREDLFKDEVAQGDTATRNTEDKDDEAAAARAELDAYMESMLGLAAYIPEPRPVDAKPKPVIAPAPAKAKPKAKKADANSDVDMESSSSSDDDDDDDETEETQKPAQPKATEFAFRLFAGSRGKEAPAPAAAAAAAAAAAPTPTVLLDDDVNGDASALGPGALMGPPRPLSHYVVGPLSDEAHARYAQTAVSGDDVIAQASPEVRNAWGLEVPWRARTVVQADKAALRALLANALAPGQPAPVNLPAALAAAVNALPAWAGGSPPCVVPGSSSSAGRKRPGKRQRIILRRRDKARREQEAAAAALAQSKQEQLSEKKKRLNRLKKLRRRQQAKAAKAGGGGAPSSVADSGNDSGGD